MKCDICPFKKDSINGPIPGRVVGEGKPTIMVIGESPSLTDDQKHKVFTGQRGQLVHNYIKEVNPKPCVYYTHLMKCRIANSKELTDDLIKNCMVDLVEEIGRIKPHVIITLGNTVLKAITGKSGITNYRGSELQYQDTIVIPTFSPNAILRSPKYLTSFKADIIKATNMSLGNASKYEYVYIPVTTKESIRGAIKTLRNHFKNNDSCYISLDFETTTFDYWRPETKIMCAGICADGKHCYSIPLEHPDSPWRGQSKKVMEFFKPFLTDPNIPVVGNNWKYDQKWLRAKIGFTANFGPDNMLISYANDENSPHDLKYQADLYCNSGKYDKDIHWPTKYKPVKDDIQKKVDEYLAMDLSRMMKYNALDAFYSWHVYPKEMGRLLGDPRMYRIYKHLLEEGSRMFVRIEETGMWVDPQRIAEATATCSEELIKVKTLLDSLIPPGWIENNLTPKQQKDGFNWNSPKQLGQLFFQKDGFDFPILMSTPTGSPSTSEAVIINLSTGIDHPVLTALLDYRRWSKYMSTYLLPWAAKLDKDSRLHPNFKLHGTVTGRLSGEDGVHQVPRDNFIRRLIGAPPGWSFFEIDGSQIELRVAAAVANESTMLRVYATGGDIHRTTAAAVSGKKPEDITSDERKKAKAVNFGFLYGMGWRKFRVYAWEKYGIRLTEAEAQQFRKRFFEMYHDLPNWHARMRNLVRKVGFVVSPIGRKRRLPNIFSQDDRIQASAEREAINSPVQGFGSDYVLAAFIETFHRIEKEDPNFETIRPVGMVHDAQYYEIRNDKIDYWAPIIKHIFDDPTRLKSWFDYTPPLPITGDCKLGNHWGDAKDWSPGEDLHYEPR